ncbi:MAG TPA: DUF177 domain-containing protein [Corynebacterium urealyticum]|nr:DUF177 domain-containing protein [Corynebacterium urealyticum]
MSNPFILDVQDILGQQGGPEHVHTTGETPHNLGGEMFGIAPGTSVDIDLILTNLGEAIMAQGTVSGPASVECGRCLRRFTTDLSIKVDQVFGTSSDFITTEDEDSDEEGDDLPPLVEDDRIDLTQTVLNEAGLNAPFNPVCADYGLECETNVPEPDGISEEEAEEEKVDPRWAGLSAIKSRLAGGDDGSQA